MCAYYESNGRFMPLFPKDHLNTNNNLMVVSLNLVINELWPAVYEPKIIQAENEKQNTKEPDKDNPE